MKKLLVSGAGGFVGARIMTQLAGRYELCAFPKGMLAAADEQTVADWVRREQPDVIVHTAALSDTGYSEKHPDESYRANVLLPCWMAAAAQKSGAKLGLRSALTRSTRALLSTGRLTRIHRSPPPTSMAATSRRWSSACWIFCPMPCCCGRPECTTCPGTACRSAVTSC